MLRLYSDENFPFPVVVALRNAGHDVMTALDDERAGVGIPDRDVLARATTLNRAILTHNRKDYIKLHIADTAHSGIIVCKEDIDFPGLAARIHAAVTALPSLIRVNQPNPSAKP